jgi:hypothetical protein
VVRARAVSRLVQAGGRRTGATENKPEIAYVHPDPRSQLAGRSLTHRLGRRIPDSLASSFDYRAWSFASRTPFFDSFSSKESQKTTRKAAKTPKNGPFPPKTPVCALFGPFPRPEPESAENRSRPASDLPDTHRPRRIGIRDAAASGSGNICPFLDGRRPCCLSSAKMLMKVNLALRRGKVSGTVLSGL